MKRSEMREQSSGWRKPRISLRSIRATNSTLLKLPPLERGNINLRQLEPFAVFGALIRKAAMPIRFNPGRVISSNCVNQASTFRKASAYLLYSPLKLIAATDLVVFAPTDQIDKTILRTLRLGRRFRLNEMLGGQPIWLA